MISSVRRRRTFSDLQRDGRRVRHGSIRIRFVPFETAEPQVAFAMSKAFGNAVERNRGRRRLRAAFVEAWPVASPGSDGELHGAYLLSGNRGLLSDAFPKLVADLGTCFEKLGGRKA